MKIPGKPLCFLSLLFILACQQKPKENTTSVNPARIDSMNGFQPEKAVNPYEPVDVSPMDMSYYPVDYPKLKMAKGDVTPKPFVRVIYSRPHLGRRRFHDILKYNEPWRLGANESTEIEFFRPATIQDKKVDTGRYIMYCIPEADKWILVLNSNTDTWGLKQDANKDLHRFEVPVTQNNTPVEYFTMVFEKTAAGTELLMAWDDVVARLPMGFWK